MLTIEGPEDFARAFAVSRETMDRLECYAAALKLWQRAHNLVAPGTLDALWQRHFADSAQLLARAPGARRWLDLGSGAGFPGMVIAILLANSPDSVVHLVDSNTRKCAFLSEIARDTEAAVQVHNIRVEAIGPESTLAAPDVITARALAPLPRLLRLVAPVFGSETLGLFPKGRQVGREIADARRDWAFDAALTPSRTERNAVILELRRPRPRAAAGAAE